MNITYVCHTQDLERCRANFLASVPLEPGDEVRLLTGAPSLAHAYHRVQHEAQTDLIVCAHEDVWFSPGWRPRLLAELETVAAANPDWGVVGVFGTWCNDFGQYYRGHVTDTFADRDHRGPPQQVQALDGLLLVVRSVQRGAWAIFDPACPGWDGYDVDISIAAHTCGGAWAITCHTEHRCRHRDLDADPNYQRSKEWLLQKWSQRPLVTTVGLWS